MIVAAGFDHAGYPLKEEVMAIIASRGADAIYRGTHEPVDPLDDYPDFALAVSREIAEGRADRGVIVCGSGAGVAIAANKVKGIRAVSVFDHYSAHQSVEHDDANVICLGARIMGITLAGELLRAFLDASFTGEERHVRRLRKIEEIERNGVAADLEGIR